MTSDEFEREILNRIPLMAPPVDAGVIPKTTPVISFGDITNAKIATLGINPSSNEFLSGGKLLPSEQTRLADNEEFIAGAVDIWFRNKNYFDETNGECQKAMDKVIELYKENEHGEDLVKDIEKVLAHKDPSSRAKEYLKRCLILVKEK